MKLRFIVALSFFAACGAVTLAPEDDGGPPLTDAGALEDGGLTLDAGSDDAGVADDDAGTSGPDAGPTADAGTPDAGRPDAGSDAGMTVADAGLRPPPPLPTYGSGTCPTLTFGTDGTTGRNRNFSSAGDQREFVLLVPTTYTPTKRYPVVFGYHWLNASANSVIRDAELTSAIEAYEFIAVVPENLTNGNTKAYQFDWPFVETTSAPKELTFFEDVLACVSQQFSVDASRVHVFGASAGGLWTTYLSTQQQVQRVASVLTISGGLGEVLGVWRIPFVAQPNKFPALIVWGGSTDWLGVNFHEASQRYRDALRQDGHPVVTCVHSAGHAIPPYTAPDGGTKFTAFWDFFRDHPLGLPQGTTPYARGLPSSFPAGCQLVP